MNKILITRSLIALSLFAGVMVSCDKDEDKIIVSASPLNAPTVSATSVTPNVDDLSAIALTLSWDKAVFSSNLVAPVYELIVSAKDKDPITITVSGSETSYSFTGKELNELLIDQLNFDAGSTVDLSFQVRTYPLRNSKSLSLTGSSVATSSSVIVAVTAVNAVAETENYYFVGSGLGADTWNIDFIGYPFYKASPDAKEYTYTAKFEAGAEFKIFAASSVGDWSKVLGNANGKLGDGGNISGISTTGYYTVTINPTAGTYSIAKNDNAATSTEYNKISIIGSAVGGWDTANDVLLENSTFNPHIWTKSGVKLGAGEFKIRVNQDWAISWGVQTGIFPASIADGGNNIVITEKNAGTYDVFFNDITKHFLFRQSK